MKQRMMMLVPSLSLGVSLAPLHQLPPPMNMMSAAQGSFGSDVQQVDFAALIPIMVSDTTHVAQPVAVTTDTGDFASGPRSYTRYLEPLACVQAARHTRDVLRASVAAQDSYDTLQYTPEQDTLPAGVAAVARACGARFTVTGVPRTQLRDLVQLALFEGEDSLARTAIARLVDAAPTDTARWEMSRWAVNTLLAAEPQRRSMAEAVVAQLDQRDSTALVVRAQLHGKLAENLFTLNRTRTLRESEVILALVQKMSVEELTSYRGNVFAGGAMLLWKAAYGLIDQAAVARPDSLSTLAQQIQTVYSLPVVQRYLRAVQLGEIPGLAQEEGGYKVDYNISPEITNWPITRVIRVWSPSGMDVDHYADANGRRLTDPGELAPRVPAMYWFPARDSVQPARGHVSLIVTQFAWNCLYREAVPLSGSFGGCDRESLSRLRYWLQHYGHAGLTVTVMAAVPAVPSSILEREPASLATMAQVFGKYQQYLQDTLGITLTIAVDTMPVVLQKPDPDLRQFYGSIALHRQYWPPAYFDRPGTPLKSDCFTVLLVDRDGTVLYRHTEFSFVTDPSLDALLKHTMSVDPSAPAVQAPSIPHPQLP